MDSFDNIFLIWYKSIKHLKYYSMLGIDSIDQKTNRISFIVTFKQKNKIKTFLKKGREIRSIDMKASLLSEIQKLDFITNIKMIDGSNSVEI